MKYLGMALIVLLFGPPLLIYHGYVDMILWQWFIVPLGVRPINLPEAIGLGIAVQAIAAPKGFKPDESQKVFRNMLIAPALALIVGWIVRMFL